MLYPVTRTTAIRPEDRNAQNTEAEWESPIRPDELPGILEAVGATEICQIDTYTYSVLLGGETNYFVLEHDETGDPNLLARAHSDRPALNKPFVDEIIDWDWTVVHGQENHDTAQPRLIRVEHSEHGVVWMVDGDTTVWAAKKPAVSRYLHVLSEWLDDDFGDAPETRTPISEIATDHRQRGWVEAMTDQQHGLHPSDHETGRGAAAAAAGRIKHLAHQLAVAGYRVELLPLGPRGGGRWVLYPDDWSEARGDVLRLLSSITMNEAARRLSGWTPDGADCAAVLAELISDADLRSRLRLVNQARDKMGGPEPRSGLLTDARSLTLEACENLERLVAPTHWRSSLEEIDQSWETLLEVARRAGSSPAETPGTKAAEPRR